MYDQYQSKRSFLKLDSDWLINPTHPVSKTFHNYEEIAAKLSAICEKHEMWKNSEQVLATFPEYYK